MKKVRMFLTLLARVMMFALSGFSISHYRKQGVLPKVMRVMMWLLWVASWTWRIFLVGVFFDIVCTVQHQTIGSEFHLVMYLLSIAFISTVALEFINQASGLYWNRPIQWHEMKGWQKISLAWFLISTSRKIFLSI